jgi:hypothetical protein
MENNQQDMDTHQVDVGHQQLAIITQLLQMSVNMRHIDEMFLWLSHSIGQRLNIEVLQLWTNQAHTTGQYSAELRVTASQNTLFPLQVVNNAQVAKIVRDLLTQRSGVSPQSVASTFSADQADLLTRYNLRYWACLFLSSDALLPLMMSKDLSHEAIPTPLTMAVSLFTQRVLNPELLPTIKHILEHALSIAKNRGLLLNVANPPLGNPANNQPQPQQLTLNELIPHWKQNIQTMQANNPLTNAIPITDKQARQFYIAIDGKKNITELADIIQLDQQEVDSALQFLLKQKLIGLHEPNGKAMDSSLFFKQL